MGNYKLVIPSAGTGSRVGPYSKFMNKALVSVGDKPSIVRIIEKFPEDIEIVIILGYKGDHIEQVVRAFYKNKRQIEFIYVDKYKGKGSGLGRTLRAAKRKLMCPFVFISNDTLIEKPNFDFDPNKNGNWIGSYKSKKEDNLNIPQYRTISEKKGKLTEILPKGVLNNNIYIGLCGILDYKIFWELMDEKKATEVGESYALRSMENISVIKFPKWDDIGSINGILRAKERYRLKNDNILEKENEAIWFCDNLVIKFHTDPKFIEERLIRTKFLDKDLIPEIIYKDKNLYVYEKEKGKIFSKVITTKLTEELLNKMNNQLWSKQPPKKINPKPALEYFYLEKTKERINYFLERFEVNDYQTRINGKDCKPSLDQLLDINWSEFYSKARIGKYHGDFHSENILENDGGFKLLDWRQNFGKLGYEYGDINYDLAKFLHGLKVSHEVVTKGEFFVKEKAINDIEIGIKAPKRNKEAEKYFEQWIISNNFDLKTIKILTSLIFLNICGLHDYPYSKFLFYLGRSLLNEQVAKIS